MDRLATVVNALRMSVSMDMPTVGAVVAIILTRTGIISLMRAPCVMALSCTARS